MRRGFDPAARSYVEHFAARAHRRLSLYGAAVGGLVCPVLEAQPERLVSVIIPALDAEDTIERCVAAVLSQSWSALEVIVVDNGSRDATAQLAERAGARVVMEDQRGRSRARNRGVAESRGSLLGFIDADCVPPADWARNCVAAIREPWLGAVQARVQKSASAPPSRTFVQAHYYWPFLDTCALMTTRAAFDGAGGFDEELARNEDMDFSFRLLASGFAFAWLPDTIVHKEHRLNARQALRRGWVGGQSLAIFAAKWRALVRVSQARFFGDLSKGVLKAALLDVRNLRSSGGIASLEALGRLLGSLETGITASKVTSTLRAPCTRLPERLGERRFPVIGPDETLLFDAAVQRLQRLNREQSRELERYIEAEENSSEGDQRVVREWGLEPRPAQAPSSVPRG
jgi:GT2 family glycosyltransferase